MNAIPDGIHARADGVSAMPDGMSAIHRRVDAMRDGMNPIHGGHGCHAATCERDRIWFGVVLDTSGSMDRTLLAKCLGTIASYCASREVRFVRLVFCDAAAYDQGYVPAEEIADRVRVKGRGGTVLQPGIDLLEKSKDFPETGPILVITDGMCDRVRIHREHAFLLPEGRSLPFVPKGKVFSVK